MKGEIPIVSQDVHHPTLLHMFLYRHHPDLFLSQQCLEKTAFQTVEDRPEFRTKWGAGIGNRLVEMKPTRFKRFSWV